MKEKAISTIVETNNEQSLQVQSGSNYVISSNVKPDENKDTVSIFAKIQKIQDLQTIFGPYCYNYNIIFENNRIVFPCDYYSINLILFFIVVLPLFLPFLNFELLNYRTYQIFSVVWPISLFILKIYFIKIVRVIENVDNCIFTEVSVFGIKIARVNKVWIKDIIEIGNNIFYSRHGSKTHLPNQKTGLFHNYKVSVLLRNGKIFNLLNVGESIEDYYASINIAKFFSDFWNIPFFSCNENNQLKSVVTYSGYRLALKEINEEKNVLKNRFFFDLKLLSIAFVLLVGFVVFIYFVSLTKSTHGINTTVIKQDYQRIYKFLQSLF